MLLQLTYITLLIMTFASNSLHILENNTLYGLKQSSSMWYNWLNEYLLKEWYKNNPICLCIFMKKKKSNFFFIIFYVNDINIIGTLEELWKAIDWLKK